MLRISGGQPPLSQPPPPDEPQVDPNTPPQAPDDTQSLGRFDVEKMDPTIVHYMTPDMGPFMCGNCHHFDGQNGCGIVNGLIDPQGVCNLFTPQTQGQDELQDPQAQPPDAGANNPQAQGQVGPHNPNAA